MWILASYYLLIGLLLVGIYGTLKQRINENLPPEHVLTILLFWPPILVILIGAITTNVWIEALEKFKKGE